MKNIIRTSKYTAVSCIYTCSVLKQPSYQFFCPAPIGGIKIERCLSLRPSVRLTVCRVPRYNSRTERPRKPKFGRMEAHDAGNH